MHSAKFQERWQGIGGEREERERGEEGYLQIHE